MTTLGVIARIVLGGVFLVSGVAKLGDPVWPASAGAFGLPPPLARPLAFFEVVLGALLVAQVAPPAPSVAALAVLGLFTGAVVAHVLRGDQVPCACFGSRSETPVSWRTVARNGTLCLLAVCATF